MSNNKPMLIRTFQFDNRAVYKDSITDKLYTVEQPTKDSVGFPLEVSLEDLWDTFEYCFKD